MIMTLSWLMRILVMRLFGLLDFGFRRRQLFKHRCHPVMGFAHAGGKAGLVGAEGFDLQAHLGALRFDLLAQFKILLAQRLHHLHQLAYLVGK
nr:hypothetical protein [uncultured Noviherbaspirillum sp.]